MIIDFKIRAIRLVIYAITMTVVLTGCSASREARSVLDEDTGATISYATTPFTLYRNTPSYGAFARNYVQLGSIEVNRIGALQYFIWLGIWTTGQVVDSAEHRDGFETIILFVDGEPLLLDLVGWSPSAIGASTTAYVKPVASATDAYYAVSIDQLRLIADAREIRIQTTSIPAKLFELWDEQLDARQTLTNFLAERIY